MQRDSLPQKKDGRGRKKTLFLVEEEITHILASNLMRSFVLFAVKFPHAIIFTFVHINLMTRS